MTNLFNMSGVLIILPDGDIPHIPSVELKNNMEEKVIVEEMGKYYLLILTCVNQ